MLNSTGEPQSKASIVNVSCNLSYDNTTNIRANESDKKTLSYKYVRVVNYAGTYVPCNDAEITNVKDS